MRFFFSTGAFTATLGNLSGLLIGHCFTVDDVSASGLTYLTYFLVRSGTERVRSGASGGADVLREPAMPAGDPSRASTTGRIACTVLFSEKLLASFSLFSC